VWSLQWIFGLALFLVSSAAFTHEVHTLRALSMDVMQLVS
jgi:hypothetical protein